MNQIQAEENIRLIREVMSRSAHYTHFSGVSGVLSGIFALFGCYMTYWITYNVPPVQHNESYVVTWVAVLVAAIAQDIALAQRKARKNGQTLWDPATYQVIKAVLPGMFVAFVVSIVALRDGALDAIPGVWALGYGVSLCSAGMFSMKEIRVYGVIQLITGAVGLFVFSRLPQSVYILALSFGVYQIIFGLWMTRKYRS